MKPEPTIDYVSQKAGEDLGIWIKHLAVDCIISIKTESNHLYTMKLLDPAEALVEITGDGNWFNVPTKAHITGSILTHESSSIATEWIGLNWCLEICPVTGDPPRVMTSRIKEAYIHGIKALPIDDGYKH